MAAGDVELEDLLAEPVEAARARGLALWPSLWAPGTPLVLHGAGHAGLRTLNHLRTQGIVPEAFADCDPHKQGTRVGGLPVLSPAEAAARWGPSGLLLVTVLNRTHNYLSTVEMYRGLGGFRTAPALAYYWAHPEAFLPHFAMTPPETVLASREEIRLAWAALSDAASRSALLGYLRWRLHLDYSALPEPSSETMYFPEGLINLEGPQCFVDCGAYDGDTFRQFLARVDAPLTAAHLFEPDPDNYRRLSARLQELPPWIAAKVSSYAMAVGSTPGRMRFQGDGMESSALCATGNLEVPVAALDQVLAGASPTFLKMDIEGAESEALAGASGLIREHGPTLAICVYHRPDHPWKIHLLLRHMLPNHAIILRAHAPDGCEWVAYALPQRHIQPR